MIYCFYFSLILIFLLSIRDLTHDRARLTGVVYKTTVTCTVECTSKNQSVALHQKLFESFNNDIQWLSIV